jgi:UDP-N-acetylmuramyl pentapeptide synthase
VRAAVCGHDVTYKIGAPGGHIVMNSLAVLAAAVELGADLALAALALGGLRAVKGRGARHLLAMRGGTATLLDESYNANPTSMRAALALLGMQQRGPAGRRIAVLGDMLELGEDADALHAGLAASIDEADVDLVFACGPHMAALWQDLPAERRGGYSQTADGLRDALVEAVRAGDAVMVKGSLGSRMGPLVETLLDTYPPRAAA